MKKTYVELTREIAALQRTAADLLSSEKKTAIDDVNALIATYQISAAELAFPQSPASRSVGALARAQKKSQVLAGSRYGDDSGNSWGGRGPRPAWLRAALAAGKTLESFSLSGAASSNSIQPQRTTKTATAKSQAGLAKYVDPKTGSAWSGRGPRPAWLKQALKKRGARIEDFAASNTSPLPKTIAPVPNAVTPARRTPKTKRARAERSVVQTTSTNQPTPPAKAVQVAKFQTAGAPQRAKKAAEAAAVEASPAKSTARAAKTTARPGAQASAPKKNPAAAARKAGKKTPHTKSEPSVAHNSPASPGNADKPTSKVNATLATKKTKPSAKKPLKAPTHPKSTVAKKAAKRADSNNVRAGYDSKVPEGGQDKGRSLAQQVAAATANSATPPVAPSAAPSVES